MNSYLVSLIVITLYLAYALLVLSVRALVTRSDIYRQWAQRATHYPRSAINSGFTPVQEAAINIPVSAATRELPQRL